MATRASVKASGETVPEVHGADKELDPHITPEQQYVSKVANTKRCETQDIENPH